MKENQFHFTKTQIEDLLPPANGRQDMYYDAKMPHLALRVSHNGHKAFLVYRWLDGRVLKRTLGTFPAMTVEQARSLASEVNAALNKGVDPLEERRAVRGEATLGEIFEQYVKLYAEDHCKTWKAMEYCFNHYLGHWRTRRVTAIRKQEVQKLHSELGKKSGPTTANRTLELLRAVIKKGVSWGMVNCQNPCVGIAKFKLKPRERFVKTHELPRLIEAIEAEPNRAARDA